MADWRNFEFEDGDGTSWIVTRWLPYSQKWRAQAKHDKNVYLEATSQQLRDLKAQQAIAALPDAAKRFRLASFGTDYLSAIATLDTLLEDVYGKDWRTHDE
jgi:hypothetical protein